MERTYYSINEDAARTAHEANSMSEFKPGRETAEYRAAVDEVYDVADAKAEAMPDYAEEAYRLADRFAMKYAEWLNSGYTIDGMCPSVLISGAGNFPVARKRRQNAARDNHMRAYAPIKAIPDRIRKLGTGGIQSGDPRAMEKLEEKLARLEERQDYMKRANAYYRKHRTLEGFGEMSEDDISTCNYSLTFLRSSNPFPSYALSNNNAKIKSTRERIARLKREKEAPKQDRTATINGEECEVVENSDIMRLQLFFDGKPGDGTRDILKHNGFRWSPRNKAWQRQLTDNARYALRRIED